MNIYVFSLRQIQQDSWGNGGGGELMARLEENRNTYRILFGRLMEIVNLLNRDLM